MTILAKATIERIMMSNQIIPRHLLIEASDVAGHDLAIEIKIIAKNPMSCKVFSSRRETEQQLIASKRWH